MNRVKRLSIVVLLAFALVLLYAGVAFANLGPHGSYTKDTDACAGCHRAHTSFSPVRWTEYNGSGVTHSALLVSSASTMQQFCYACHGDAAPGASTNVQSGIFDGGPSGVGGLAGSGIYKTNSSALATLNGGGFERVPNGSGGFLNVTSIHDNSDAVNLTAWGGGQSASAAQMALTCTSCHDPHGSANYRLLRDTVNGHVVGGYDETVNILSPPPTPWVISAEEGYPTGGWLLHDAGASQVASYLPNYTKAEYAYMAPAAGSQRSMSGWCSACHERYIVRDDTVASAQQLSWGAGAIPMPGMYDYGAAEADAENAISPQTGSVGARARHRHPVNVTLGAGVGPASARALARHVVTDTLLPLEQRAGSPNFRGDYDYQDYISCLTCHVAHGTSVTMTGWAESSLITTDSSAVVTWFPVLDAPGAAVTGVDPTKSSALLRADNRGVCERCHNK